MQEVPGPLSYATPATGASSDKTVWRVLLAGLLGGMVGLFAMASFLGDVDDDWWMFILAGGLPAVVAAFVTRNRFLPGRLACWVAGSFFGIAVLIDIASVASLVLGANVFTGEQLIEMDTLLPLVWMIASVVPMLAGVFMLLAAKPRAWNEVG
jgi:hypothetical protein